jgi:hypothetical protein
MQYSHERVGIAIVTWTQQTGITCFGRSGGQHQEQNEEENEIEQVFNLQ